MTREEQIKREAAWQRSVSEERAFIRGAQWADEHPHWISVEEELPKENEWVLTCNRGGSVNLLMLAGNGYWYDKDVGLHHHITHWMPLPAPPKIRD